MGAGASVEEGAEGSARLPDSGRPPSTYGSGRNTPNGSRPTSRRASLSSTNTWRSAFKNPAINNSSLRKIRAAALGRKSAVTVRIDKTGFSLQHIQICEGQVVSWEWNEPDSQGFNVTQVSHDGDQYRSVPGGFNSGQVTKHGHFSQQFNLIGEYKFVSAGIRCTPLIVEVFERKDVEAKLDDQGFAPKIIRVDEGSGVTWRWSGCSLPHTVTEARYSHKRGAMVQKEHAEKAIPTKAGSFRSLFPKPGIFYFQTEGTTTGVLHTCIVHVRERQRESRIEVLDRTFSPAILVIEEGDRVWWMWTRENCKKTHCIYEIEPPPLSHPSEEAYKPIKNGFKWPQPSKAGLMSYEFYEPGVYYFSDHNFDEAAEYIGTIIVRPKTKEHFIEVTEEGFSPDVLYANTGDRVWWTWSVDDVTIPRFNLREVDKVLSPLASRPSIEDDSGGEGSYMDEALENMKVQVGLDVIMMGSIGVYTHCLADPDQRSIATCSIISSAGPRNHTVHVTDSGFEPKVVTVHPNDRIWWVWQDTKKQHNIIQVSHQGNHIKGGFCSGASSDSPSAFMTEFTSPGVYYYISKNLAKSFGAIVVSSQPKVHKIQIQTSSITPDPVIMSMNDVACWIFKGLRHHDVQELNTVDQLLDIQLSSPHLQHPRRTLCRLATEKGVHHYTSKSFLKSTKGDSRSDESRISTLLVDDASDSMVVRINSQGFHPKNVNITQGQSVLWTWKEAGEESHNIIHVNPPDSDTPLSVIHGGQSFSSGRPVAKNSFLYTFDEPNTYCVASQGAPGFAGTVTVLSGNAKTATPRIMDEDSLSGTVDKNFTIHLSCNTPGSNIYYTLDGSAPDLSRVIPKLYNPDRGVILKQSGLVLLRAIAISKNALNSEVVTSKRFWVLRGDEDNASVSSGEPEPVAAANSASLQWWQCVPVVKGCFTSPGVMEVFWELPPTESTSLVKGYQVFLNGVSYCDVFPANHNSVNIAGLAGGRLYEIILEVYPTEAMFLPHKSNKLVMKCPKTTGTGGPLISLEQTGNRDTLAIVWMAISTEECPIDGYRVYLNREMVGSKVVPDANRDRCKVVIDGCNLGTTYHVVVAAIPEDGSSAKMSNELEVKIPLDFSLIRLPPVELRAPDEDLYKEYIEVSEGSSYVESESATSHQAEPVTFDLMDHTMQTHSESAIQANNLDIEINRERNDQTNDVTESEASNEQDRNDEMVKNGFEENVTLEDLTTSGLGNEEDNVLGDTHEVQNKYKALDLDKSSVTNEEFPQSEEENHENGMEASEVDCVEDQVLESSEREVGESCMTDKTFTDVSILEDITTTDDDATVKPQNSSSKEERNGAVLENAVNKSNISESVGNVNESQTTIQKYRTNTQSSEESVKIDDKSSENSNKVDEKKDEPKPDDEGFDGDKDDIESIHENETDKGGENSQQLALMNRKNVEESKASEMVEGESIEYEILEEPHDILDRGSKTNLFPLPGQADEVRASSDGQEEEVPTMSDEDHLNEDAEYSESGKMMPESGYYERADAYPHDMEGYTDYPPMAAETDHVLERNQFQGEDDLNDDEEEEEEEGEEADNTEYVDVGHQYPAPRVPEQVLQPTRHRRRSSQVSYNTGHGNLGQYQMASFDVPPVPPAPGQPANSGLEQNTLASGSRGSLRSLNPPPAGTVMQYPPAIPTGPGVIVGPPVFTPHPPQDQPNGKPPQYPQMQLQSSNHTLQHVPLDKSQIPQSPQPMPPSASAPAPPQPADAGPYLEGVRYHSHLYPAPDKAGEPAIGFIDATKGPWKNRMKCVADATRAVMRMDFETSVDQSRSKGIEVEVDDEGDSPPEGVETGQKVKKKKKKRTTAVIEVQDGAHLKYEQRKEITTASSAVPVLGQQEGQDQYLPAPVVSAESRGNDSVLIRWSFQRSSEPLYRLLVCVVNVVGKRFAPGVGSDISFECYQQEGDTGVAAIQHCWNVTSGSDLQIGGLLPGINYTIFVVANYALTNAKTPTELQAKSEPIKYTTIGPPPSPVLRPFATGLYQVTLAWDAPAAHSSVEVIGYRVLVDDRQLGDLLQYGTHKTTIDNLQPGRTILINVIAVTNHQVGSSEPSNTIRVTCPRKPPSPLATQQPSYKRGSVVVGWEKPNPGESLPYGEDIIMYRVFVDKNWHGEVNASSAGNRSGYQYYLTGMAAGQAYDINVRTYAGQHKVDPQSDHIYCISESEESNTVPVMSPAPPKSPSLRVEGMHVDGIDINWEMPQQFGDALISGYQLMKDGKLYGSIMPPDVHSLRIKDVVLGDRVTLQILALTDHPVGRQNSREKGEDGDGDSGVGTGTQATDEKEQMAGYQEVYIGDRYSACRPGPKLSLIYTGLVKAPAKVWCEKATGHSAMIVWEYNMENKAHFIQPENYQITWWPKDQKEEEINSQATKDDHLLITGLKPNVLYNVVVEARKMQTYSAINEGDKQVEDGYDNMFILTGKSEILVVRTSRPPPPPTNLGITATTTHSLQVAWDPPTEASVDLLGIRVDAVGMKTTSNRKHASIEVMPDATTATLENLEEKTEYLVSVTYITEEYFEQLPDGSEIKTKRTLPENTPPPDDPWLSNSSMIAMTSGSEAPTDLKIKGNTISSITVSWTPPVVFGSNRLQGTVVRWSDANMAVGNDNNLAHHKSIVADCNEATIEDLYPGIKYKVVVEAVVSVKTNIIGDARDPETEKLNRRTAHVPSDPLFVRTKAPCEPPKPIITAYSTDTIQLYWEKPLLYAVIGKDGYGNPKYLKMSLEGYRLEINGKPHMRLIPTAQSCTLVKCRPGKNYQIVLVALTCTDDVKKEKRRKAKELHGSSAASNKEWEEDIDAGENDESPSEPIDVSLPAIRDDLLSDFTVNFASPSGVASEKYAGDVHVEWGVQGNANRSKIASFLLTWRCTMDGSLQRKVVTPSSRIASIPVGYPRSVFDVFLEPQFEGEALGTETQKCQVLVPGPPEPPEIWMRSVGRDEFVIEWGEPRLYGVRVAGYQVYLNGKQVGNELNTTHRKAVIPCKPQKRYKVNLKAISADPNCVDSVLSNTLIITSGADTVQNIEGAPLTQDDGIEDTIDLPVKVVKVTDKSIQIDWVDFTPPEGVLYYRVTWSSVAQPSEREVKLSASEKSCVLHKCFPGTNHFLRLYAMGRDEKILDLSKQLTVQTCAPPDTLVVTVRACNFRYIAIQWDKPNTYGDTLVTGYKVYVNGVVEAVLGPDQFTFSFTQGHWCREYAFQVQATTAVDKLNSKPSEPLVVTWPGVQPPELQQAPSVSGNSVKVVWDRPPATDGIKIKMYKVICVDEETQQPVQVISPIHPETTGAELHNLKAGSYLVFAEVHIHGTNDVVKSESLKIRPTLTPDPPNITVTVIGLEERRQVEKITCDLINKRDRLINFLTNREVSQSLRINDEDQVLVKVTEDLAHIEDKLDDCLASLSHYTGHILAHVSWTCPQSNPDIRVSGYKVLVDGKQYGTSLHAGIQNVRIKLGLQAASHHLSMVSVCDHPHTTSSQSNVVELLTEPFKPFSFFSFLESGGPKTAGLYAPTLITERKHKRTINQGLLKRHIPPPSATLMEVFEGEYHPLFPPSGPRSATALLFWAKWNPASKKALSWFVRFARQCTQYEFIAVACTAHDPTANDRQELVHVISENGWRDKCVRHVTSHCAKATTMGSEYIKSRNGEIDESTSTDLTQLFGIGGIPMIAIVHPGDYIAWKGRYCAFDYISFENFMQYIFAQTTGEGPPKSDPWDTDIDMNALDGVSKRAMSESQLLIHRPTNNMRLGTGTTSTHRLNGNRPASGKKPLFRKVNQKKGKDKLSVANRPYSASSPYSQKLVSEDSMGAPPPRRRIKSGRKTDGNY